MAAFENISRVVVRPFEAEEDIDIRTARLPSLVPEDDGYDPRRHRTPKTPIKLHMAYFNLLRIGFGAGVLGFPLAISQVGILMGPILSTCTGLLILHTHITLLKCLNEISRQLRIPNISYRYGFRIALIHGPPLCHCIGRHGPCIIAIFMVLSQLGICTVFVSFTSDSLRDILDYQTSRPSLLILIIPYLVIQFLTKNLKIVSYVSMTGNLMNVVGIILLFYQIFKDPQKDVVLFTKDPMAVLFAFGTFMFNMSVVGVVLSLDKALADPYVMVRKCGVLTVGILVPTTIATIFGILGYWSFGAMEENVLRSLPFDDEVAMAAIGLYLMSVALAYPIQCFPGVQVLLEVIQNHDPYNPLSKRALTVLDLFSRPIFVLITFTISYFIPFQGPFVAFVGNLCTTMLALVFPAMMELCLMYPGPYGKYNLYLIKNIAIIFLGCVSWIFGMVFCGKLIYVRIKSSESPNDAD